MALALILLVGAACLGKALGGSFASFASLSIHGTRLVVIAVGAQLVGTILTRATSLNGCYPAGLAVSAIAALAFCGRNIRLSGVPLITLGLLSNALVVSLNGSMPVSVDAAVRANVSTVTIAAGHDARHTIAGPDSTLRELGDVIPLPVPSRAEVVSPGDALLAAGLGELVFLGMRRRRFTSEPVAAASRKPAAVALS